MAPFGEGSSFSGGVQNFRSVAYEDQCLTHWRKLSLFFVATSERDSMISIDDISTYPTIFPNIFSSFFGAFELAAFWQCIFLFLQNEPI